MRSTASVSRRRGQPWPPPLLWTAAASAAVADQLSHLDSFTLGECHADICWYLGCRWNPMHGPMTFGDGAPEVRVGRSWNTKQQRNLVPELKTIALGQLPSNLALRELVEMVWMAVLAEACRRNLDPSVVRGWVASICLNAERCMGFVEVPDWHEAELIDALTDRIVLRQSKEMWLVTNPEAAAQREVVKEKKEKGDDELKSLLMVSVEKSAHTASGSGTGGATGDAAN